MSTQPPLAVLNAMNGQLELYRDRLVIRRRGWLARFIYHSPGDPLTIELQRVTAARLYHPQFLYNGLLSIRFVDDQERVIALVYRAKEYQAALKIKEEIEDHLSRSEMYPLMKEIS